MQAAKEAEVLEAKRQQSKIELEAAMRESKAREEAAKRREARKAAERDEKARQAQQRLKELQTSWAENKAITEACHPSTPKPRPSHMSSMTMSQQSCPCTLLDSFHEMLHWSSCLRFLVPDMLIRLPSLLHAVLSVTSMLDHCRKIMCHELAAAAAAGGG